MWLNQLNVYTYYVQASKHYLQQNGMMLPTYGNQFTPPLATNLPVSRTLQCGASGAIFYNGNSSSSTCPQPNPSPSTNANLAMSSSNGLSLAHHPMHAGLASGHSSLMAHNCCGVEDASMAMQALTSPAAIGSTLGASLVPLMPVGNSNNSNATHPTGMVGQPVVLSSAGQLSTIEETSAASQQVTPASTNVVYTESGIPVNQEVNYGINTTNQDLNDMSDDIANYEDLDRQTSRIIRSCLQ